MDQNSTRTASIGIDTSKQYLDVRLILGRQQGYCRFPQSPEGYQQLVDWLNRVAAGARLHFCLEATGRYSNAPAAFLAAAGHLVSVVNPMLIKHEAQAWGARNKTDKADARIIALYCQDKKPPAHRPLEPNVAELQERVRHRDNLSADRQRLKNRISEPGLSNVVRRSLEKLIASFDQEIKEIEEEIKTHIKSDSRLCEDSKLLQSVPGIGEVTAAAILSEIPPVDACPSAKSLAAYAGLNPSQRQSGSSSKPSHISRMGSSRLRKYLYLPAMAALRFNPSIAALAGRLAERRHSKMSVITAAMRKLLMLAYGVLKSRQPYKADYSKNVTLLKA